MRFRRPDRRAPRHRSAGRQGRRWWRHSVTHSHTGATHRLLDQKKRIAGAWKNNPDQFGGKIGTVIDARNIGGEAHSFTRVASFGGGIVPVLNELSRNPVVAPECANLDPSTIVPAGGHMPGAPLVAGTYRFQCCIHPWMRTTAVIKGI